MALSEASNVLTLGVDKLSLANDFEAAFSAISPLQKGYDINTNTLTLGLASNLGNITSDNINVNTNLFADIIKPNTNTLVTVDESLTVHGQFQINNRLNNATAGQGQIYLNGGTGNRIDFNNNGVALPTLTNRSVGTKLLLYPSLNSTTSDFAIGIGGSELWSTIGASVDSFKWYAGGNNIATLSGTGNLTVTGDLTVNGNTTFASTNPYHAGGTIDINGNILLQKGKNNFTCASAGTLAWTITYPAHPSGANAVVLVTSGHYHTLIRSQTSTSFVLYGRDTTNGTTDQTAGQPLHFVVLV